jgi:MYXO-CTERM domain-containing protein
MRTFLAVILTVSGLMFGGVGVANATTALSTPVATSTTVVAQEEADDDGGDAGLWGLAGLLGLAGLTGLLRRRDNVRRDTAPGTGLGGGGTVPPQR